MIIIIIIMIIIIELIIRSLGRHISPQERPYYDWKSGGLYLGPKAMMLMMMFFRSCQFAQIITVCTMINSGPANSDEVPKSLKFRF